MVGRQRQAGTHSLRDVVPERGDSTRGAAPRAAQAPVQDPHRDPGGAVLMASGIAAPELRELDAEALTSRLREAKEELFNLRFQMATGQLTNNRRLRVVRHDIARIYTVMRERELGLSAAPGDAQ